MKVLTLELSSPIRSVAVHAVQTSGSGSVPVILGQASDEIGKSLRPLELVELALARAGLEREAIEGLAVGLGPGSYTGIRSAIALAQGWQLGRPVRILGLSSADGLAASAHAQGWFGEVGVVIDAQRDEFYFAGYEIGPSGCRQKVPLRIATRSEIPALGSAYPTLVGPDAAEFFPMGRLLLPNAEVLGRLAAGRSDFIQGEKLEPIYLRETKFVKAPPPRIVPGV